MPAQNPPAIELFTGDLPDPADRPTYGTRGRAMWLWEILTAIPGMNAQSAVAFQNALFAKEMADQAASVAGFRGHWSLISGAVATPASVYHEEQFWVLLENVANVALHEPGVSSVWALIDETSGVRRIVTGNPLPETDVGPIWADDYYAMMIWRTIGSYTGYTSVNLGHLTYYDGAVLPPGYLAMNGATLTSTYAALAQYRGSYTLRDLRGKFLRVLDQGRGIDPGRVHGSNQGDAIRNISGTFQTWIASGGTGAFVTSALTTGNRPVTGSQVNYIARFDSQNVVPTANENRPDNVALPVAVKF